MKHMKHIYMILGALAVAAAGYMAYQRYYANQDSGVKVQFLDFGGSHGGWGDHSSDWRAGYEAGQRDAQNN